MVDTKFFGELLDMYAPTQLTTSTGLLHPGYYYHAAASYAIERKKSAKRLIAVISLFCDLYLSNLPKLVPAERLTKYHRDASTLNSSVPYVGQSLFDDSQEEGHLRALATVKKIFLRISDAKTVLGI